jgi:omega-6 fatty acid desaturase (delta-12 desaturase)
MHHVHHLCSRIPYYRLPRALRDHPELRDVSRLTMLESFNCVRLSLWDERERRLISFREMRRISANDGEARSVRSPPEKTVGNGE